MKNLITLTFVIIALFIGLSSANAQKIGLRAEYGINSFKSESMYLLGPNKTIDYELTTADVSNSNSIGLFTSFKFGYLFLQPEVLYTQYESTFKLSSFGESRVRLNNKVFTQRFQQVDMPIVAGVHYKRLKFGAGPVFHFGETIKTDALELENLEIKSNNFSTGYQLGVGVSFDYFDIDVKYQGAFNQANDHIIHRNAKTAAKNSTSTIKVGIAVHISK